MTTFPPEPSVAVELILTLVPKFPPLMLRPPSKSAWFPIVPPVMVTLEVEVKSLLLEISAVPPMLTVPAKSLLLPKIWVVPPMLTVLPESDSKAIVCVPLLMLAVPAIVKLLPMSVTPEPTFNVLLAPTVSPDPSAPPGRTFNSALLTVTEFVVSPPLSMLISVKSKLLLVADKSPPLRTLI